MTIDYCTIGKEAGLLRARAFSDLALFLVFVCAHFISNNTSNSQYSTFYNITICDISFYLLLY